MMRILKSYLKDRVMVFSVLTIFVVTTLVTFLLEKNDLSLFTYPLLLASFVSLLLILIDYYAYQKEFTMLIKLQEHQFSELSGLIASPQLSKKYIKLIDILQDRNKAIMNKNTEDYQKSLNYYTLWMHQIKTPISACKLMLQSDHETFNGGKFTLELKKIEQYSDLVLNYVRIQDISNDFEFKEQDLFPIIKDVIKQNSTFFIHSNIALNLEAFSLMVITDKKWIEVVIQQLLSNALKYTNKGEISFHMSGSKLIIKDTGIGIASEDLPRIFEQGFTGKNGRIETKSSGLGLYLTRTILDKLKHRIVIESEVGSGTSVIIDFEQNSSLYD